MQRDREYLLDILEAAKIALEYVSDKNKVLRYWEKQRGESRRRRKLLFLRCHGAT